MAPRGARRTGARDGSGRAGWSAALDLQSHEFYLVADEEPAFETVWSLLGERLPAAPAAEYENTDMSSAIARPFDTCIASLRDSIRSSWVNRRSRDRSVRRGKSRALKLVRCCTASSRRRCTWGRASAPKPVSAWAPPPRRQPAWRSPARFSGSGGPQRTDSRRRGYGRARGDLSERRGGTGHARRQPDAGARAGHRRTSGRPGGVARGSVGTLATTDIALCSTAAELAACRKISNRFRCPVGGSPLGGRGGPLRHRPAHALPDLRGVRLLHGVRHQAGLLHLRCFRRADRFRGALRLPRFDRPWRARQRCNAAKAAALTRSEVSPGLPSLLLPDTVT